MCVYFQKNVCIEISILEFLYPWVEPRDVKNVYKNDCTSQMSVFCMISANTKNSTMQIIVF